MHSSDWNDLRHVLAVAEHGSLARAARALGVNHTTVLRRVAAFEDQLGVRLFDRRAGGYAATAAGEQLADLARTIRESVVDVERRLAGQDLRLTGTVRVTTTDTLAQSVLPAALAGLAALHPDVQLELTVTNFLVSLARRDADIAVRPAADPPPNLIGRRIATVAFALYAAPSYLAHVPARRSLGKHTWIAPDDSLAATAIGRWMTRTLPDARIALRADTLTALAHAAAAGVGAVALPCYLGDTTPGLHRMRDVVADMSTSLWVLTHEDLRATVRVRAVTEVLTTALSAQRDLFEGRRAAR